MLRSVNSIKGYALEAVDGEIGQCQDFLFDDEHWTIRYMVADTGRWLRHRTVLISPISLGEAHWHGRAMTVNLTCKEIEESPPLDSDAPICVQRKRRLVTHSDWPLYWIGDGIWGSAPAPAIFEAPELLTEVEEGDPHLRSTSEVSGYAIAARDGDIGCVTDFIMNESTWVIRFAVVETGGWLSSRRVLIAPRYIESVRWENRHVNLNITKEQIKASPPFNASEPINRDYEERLYDYYGRPKPRSWTP